MFFSGHTKSRRLILVAAKIACLYRLVVISGLDGFTPYLQYDNWRLTLVPPSHKHMTTHNKAKTATGLSTAVVTQHDSSNNRTMKTVELVLLLIFFPVTLSVKHSLKFIFTTSSGVKNIPDFVVVGVIDEVTIGYCDSISKKAEANLDWSQKFLEDDPQLWNWFTHKCLLNRDIYTAQIDSLKQQLNQTEGVHIFQRRNGCEWDDETGEVHGFVQFGYDGEDFLAFDPQTLTWIALKPQAVITKDEWDREKVLKEIWNDFLTQLCPKLVKRCLDYRKSFLLRRDLPSVSLLQKTPSSPVSCFATGFYPQRAMMFWRKDGEELHEDVEHGEILPNHDGSFQMSVDLNLSSVTPEDWRRYECVFQLSGVKDDIVTKLDKAVIRTNCVSPSEFPTGPVIGGVVGLLLLLAVCITGVFIWRRRDNGFRPSIFPDLSSCDSSSVKDVALN